MPRVARDLDHVARFDELSFVFNLHHRQTGEDVSLVYRRNLCRATTRRQLPKIFISLLKS
jgi:hypothetical protein